MKHNQDRYDEYVREVDRVNLHPELAAWMDDMPDSVAAMRSLIFYGPSGSGKYSQALRLVRRYSKSELRYNSSVSVVSNKQSYKMRISDIHYEVDAELLGCNAKGMWNDIHVQITDIVNSRQAPGREGIILIKNFHRINSDLLESLYSYVRNETPGTSIRYLFLTEAISFLPRNLVLSCDLVRVVRPTPGQYMSVLSEDDPQPDPRAWSNIKDARAGLVPPNPERRLGAALAKIVVDQGSVDMNAVRQLMYDGLVYNLDLHKMTYFLLERALEGRPLVVCGNAVAVSMTFLHYYNNNYRPIYHLERLVYGLIKSIHEL